MAAAKCCSISAVSLGLTQIRMQLSAEQAQILCLSSPLETGTPSPDPTPTPVEGPVHPTQLLREELDSVIPVEFKV